LDLGRRARCAGALVLLDHMGWAVGPHVRKHRPHCRFREELQQVETGCYSD